MAPDVSVIIPVYNPGDLLEGCLTSVLTQTLGTDRIELIAVDDGSTDGSDAVLDRFAEQHPGVVHVVHQANSGGPATPCNVGLARARGRYVYFLGSDDQLGPEALARMVAAADEWGSDVLAARIVGVGRVWGQSLYAENRADLEFPSRLLAGALSNTKLFRRSLLTEHAITYPLDLRIGSDQPFTVAALLAARRISALGDYDYYLAYKRPDNSNLTFSTGWRTRLDCLARVIRWIASRIPAGEGRDQVLQRHFGAEFAELLRDTRPELAPSDRADLDATVTGLCDELLTDEIRETLPTWARIRYELEQAGLSAELDSLVGVEDRTVPLRQDEQGWYLAHEPMLSLRGRASLRVVPDRMRSAVSGATAPASVEVVDRVLVVRARIELAPQHLSDARLVLRKVDGELPGPWSRPLDPAGPSTRGWAVEPVPGQTAHTDLVVRIPFEELPARTRKDHAVRWQFDIDGTRYTVPVTTGGKLRLGQVGQRRLVWRPDERGRVALHPLPRRKPAAGAVPVPTAETPRTPPPPRPHEPQPHEPRPGPGGRLRNALRRLTSPGRGE